MAEKETHSERPCFVCGKPAYLQFDKNGKLYVMCDGRHPQNAGCGCRVYLGPGNSARIKSEAAINQRKGKTNGGKDEGQDNGGPGVDHGPANDPANDNGTGGGERKRAGGGWGLGEW